ncbi:hypothetical protein J5N97_007569 [Dioscorea zingiberensis]|uniref:Uncharacterized protein n=1 Tax=Dioscorea zingiberensis TaxID=325984 RepID=A0A9D5DDP3_9LILI|nr:hypothetical protein J5N97_007569 [Dioscorea zingiberensis]
MVVALLHTSTPASFLHSGNPRPIFSPPYPLSNLSFRSSIPHCSSPSISPLICQSSHPIRLTYLEGNSWLWDVAGLNLLVDPILLEDLPELDCLLITQSLDDHCHVKTLKPLSKMCPHLPVVATPNAEPILGSLFSNVIYLEQGQKFEVDGRDGGKVDITATAVSGQEDAVQLAKLLQAKYIVPMKNGDQDAKGILSAILYAEGTIESFKELLSRELPEACMLEPIPGVPLEISLSPSVK